MAKLPDRIGQTFGRLIVLSKCDPPDLALHPVYKAQTWWKVKCSCNGATKPVPNSSLKSGRVNSCGCIRKERGKIKLAEILERRKKCNDTARQS